MNMNHYIHKQLKGIIFPQHLKMVLYILQTHKYPNKHKVIYMPFDYNWGIKPNFLVVCDAILIANSIHNALTMLIETNQCIGNDVCIANIYNLFKDIYETLLVGLINYGCTSSSTITTVVTSSISDINTLVLPVQSYIFNITQQIISSSFLPSDIS